MKALPFSILVLLAAGCASQPGNTSGFVRYECYTYVGSNHALTLPVPTEDVAFPVVQIRFHGDQFPAIYQRNGLTQIWSLEDGLYIQVDPDFVAHYMDFRGAEEGEQRKPVTVLQCKKRK